MLTIQSMMLVLLGVLLSALVALLLGPAYRSRIVRLTTERLKQSMPLTEAEIRADKDRLRADYALHIHKQSLELAEVRAIGSRQVVELNRRDAEISRLTREVERLSAVLEEGENARRVLEQTIQDRLPRVEHRLAEAKKLIFQRDRDIATLTNESERTLRALDEAMQINAQQRSELARIQSSAIVRGATATESLTDPRFDAEVALRSEIDSLREKNREQAALIARLTSAAASAVGGGEQPSAVASPAVGEARPRAGVEDANAGGVHANPQLGDLRQLRAELDDKTAEVARLTAALAAYESVNGEPATLSVKDSRIALKSKVGSLQAKIDAQAETIRKLRAEAAASNERLARQAQQHMEEMRRLGVGTLPAGPPSPRRPEAAAKRSLAERVSQVGAAASEPLATAPVAANDTTAPDARRAAAVPSRAVANAEPAASPPVEPARKPRLMERIADIGKSG